MARWALHDAAGATLRHGVSTLDAIPRAPHVTALVPASRVVFIETPLPRTAISPQKRDALVRYAIEDKLTIDPATVHAVVLDRPRGAMKNHIVAAIDRAWFTAALAWLQASGRAPRAVFAETMLLPVAANEWSVQLANADAQAYARRADGYAYALDASSNNAPPFALTLALSETVEKPAAIALYEGGSAISLDLQRHWEQALGIPVRMAGAATKVLTSQKNGNLLTGEFALPQPARAWLALAKPALALSAIIAALQLAFMVADWWQLDRKRFAIEREMRATFQATFPQATAIVDPALQMHRNLDALKRERGMTKADDPRIGLARLAAMTASVPQFVITAVAIKDGNAKLVGKLSTDAAMQALQERVAAIPGAALTAGAIQGTIEITLRVGT